MPTAFRSATPTSASANRDLKELDSDVETWMNATKSRALAMKTPSASTPRDPTSVAASLDLSATDGLADRTDRAVIYFEIATATHAASTINDKDHTPANAIKAT